jgi:hypothetical protein
MTPRRSERDIQAAIVAVLKAHGILAFRMNAGAMGGIHKGKRWYVRFGFPGMADILAFPLQIVALTPSGPVRAPVPLWIECKSSRGKQKPDQEHFQLIVEQAGHTYLLARSASEVLDWIKNNTARG